MSNIDMHARHELSREDAQAAARSCHTAFFGRSTHFDVILLGCGNVGSELLEQFQRQSDTLAAHHMDLRVRAIANSKKLLVADILVRFCEQIPYAFVVVWCMKTISSPVSALQFGILTSIEMATAVLVYMPVAYLADKTTKKPFVVMTFVFFTLFPLALLYSHSLEWLIAAFVLRGFKEFGEPTRKSLIMDLSPNNCKAGMFGLYYLIRDVFVAVAALGGAFLWQISPQTNLITAFVFGIIGTVGFAAFGRDIPAPIKDRK